MGIGPADVPGGFWVDVIKVTAPCRNGYKKKKKRDNASSRIQPPQLGHEKTRKRKPHRELTLNDPKS